MIVIYCMIYEDVEMNNPLPSCGLIEHKCSESYLKCTVVWSSYMVTLTAVNNDPGCMHQWRKLVSINGIHII